MLNPNKLRIALVAALSGISATAVADNAAMLDTITVTASPLSQEVGLAPSRVDVISGAEKKARDTSSLGRFLQDVPGVSSANTGAQAGTPVIRGLTGNRITVMSNGVAQEYQQDAIRHIPNLDPSMYSRIEVVRGPMSVLYGSGAMGGVINALTPSPFERTENGVGGELTTRYESNNKARMGGLQLSARQNGFGLQAGGFLTRADDYRSAKTITFQTSRKPGDPLFAGTIPFTDYQSKNGYISAGHRGDYGDLTLSWVRWHQKQNYLILAPQQGGLPNPAPVGQDLQNDNIELAGTFFLTDDWVLKPSYNFQRNQRTAQSGTSWRELSSLTPDVDVVLDKNTVKLGIEHPEFAGWRGEWGLEYAHTQQDLKSGALTPDAQRDQFAIYAFEEKRLGSVIIEAGLRYDHISQQAEQSAAYPDVDTQSRDYGVFSGSLGAAWLVNNEWTLRGNLGRGFRAPAFAELYSDGIHGGIAADQRGNPDLKAETSLNLEAGIDWSNNGVDLSATVYQNRFSDYIYLANTGQTGRNNLPVYQFEQTHARLRGVELAAQWQINEQWSAQASYDAVRGEMTSSGDTLPLMPADSVTARLDYQLASLGAWQSPRAWTAVRHVFSQNAAGPYEPLAQFDNQPFGTASTDAYTLWSIGAGVNRKLANDLYLNVDFRIENLLDTAYRDFLDTYKGYAMSQGRNIQLNMSLAF